MCLTEFLIELMQFRFITKKIIRQSGAFKLKVSIIHSPTNPRDLLEWYILINQTPKI